MVERGDFVVPRFLGRAFLDKPILFFWAQAASLATFGMNTAAARLPGIVLALLGIATTGWLARLLFDARTAWVAAICYATMALPFALAQAPVHDIAVVPFTNLALGFLWRAGRDCDRDPGSGIRDALLAGVVLGLSILAKGFAGVAIVGLAYGGYLVVTRRLTWRIAARGALVVVVAVLVALPWNVAMNAREPGYLHYYFVERHLLGFATQTQEHAGQPWWFYLPVVLGGGLPWIVFAPAGRVLSDAPGKLLLWSWLLGAVVLLTLSGSKAVTYVLPAMPAIAILAGASLQSERYERTWQIVAGAAAAVYALALFTSGPVMAYLHSARDLAGYFNASTQLPRTIFVFDQRVSFVFYLNPEVRARLSPGHVRSVSVEEVAAMQPFPHDAVLTLPADLAPARLPRIPALAGRTQEQAGRYLVVRP